MQITFEIIEGLEGIAVSPSPSKNYIPEWFKKMSTEAIPLTVNKQTGISYRRTVKACPPILDYLCTGYILSTWTDIVVAESGYDKSVGPKHMFYPSLNSHKLYEVHWPDMVKGSSLEGQDVYKLLSPWNIKTPKGYSCLFIKPQFSDTKGINIITAIVDTDVYHSVNFPFTFDVKNSGMFIPKDTPVVHVIPFKRQDWSADYSVIKKSDHVREHNKAVSVIKNFYRKLTKVNRRNFT